MNKWIFGCNWVGDVTSENKLFLLWLSDIIARYANRWSWGHMKLLKYIVSWFTSIFAETVLFEDLRMILHVNTYSHNSGFHAFVIYFDTWIARPRKEKLSWARVKINSSNEIDNVGILCNSQIETARKPWYKGQRACIGVCTWISVHVVQWCNDELIPLQL